MSRFLSSILGAAAIGQLVGLAGWIDPIFIPLVLVGPVITGAVAAAKRASYRWIAVVWCSAGLSMLWTDWALNNEDQLFHLGLAVVMPLLAGVGWGATRLATRSRSLA